MRKRNERGLTEGGVIVLVIVGIIALGFAIWGVSVALAPVFGKGEAFKKTESADYRISNYDKFKDDCNAIVATESKILIARESLDREQVGPVDSPREQQLAQNVSAIENVRAEQIAQYNSDASKNETRAKFKDAGLPDSINVNDEIGSLTCPSE